MFRLAIVKFGFAINLLAPKYVCSEDLTGYVRFDHDTTYHEMVKFKDEFRCDLLGHQYYHHNKTCIEPESAHRHLLVTNDNVHKVKLNIFNFGPDKPNMKPGDNRAKTIYVNVAADAPVVGYELDDEPVDENNKDGEWYGTEIVSGENIIPGSATFIKSTSGAVSGSISSFEHGLVFSLSTRGNQQFVEVTPHDSYPDEFESTDEDRASIKKEWKRQSNSAKNQSRKNSRILNRKLNSFSFTDASNGNTVITVMVVYTMKAMCADAGQPYPCPPSYRKTIESRIDLALTQTNEAMKYSRTKTMLRLVKKLMVDYDESSDWSNTLRKLTWKQLDQSIYTNRDRYRADVVHMVMAKGGYCGYGYIKTLKNDSFSISNYKCATGMYSFAHEVAHNLGCDHNIENAYSNSRFARGYQDPNAKFRTVMAYSCRNGNCPRALLFSHGRRKYKSLKAGSRNENNARQIRQYSKTVAAFY
uniref:Peptidase M12B domain-containing protein n=1 Tax=Corethron hystrix TaxID=216773 RepID=A0A6U5L0Z8_9STRA|mmetsp:Transcript_42305/g.99235  ORF Transcript_42305/g.99235 Transcript_42305/m.99235 type:complete len:472 (+) Transcript_42305:160-1575(+)